MLLLYSTHNKNKKRTKPQLLTGGSISLLEANGHDKKDSPRCPRRRTTTTTTPKNTHSKGTPLVEQHHTEQPPIPPSSTTQPTKVPSVPPPRQEQPAPSESPSTATAPPSSPNTSSITDDNNNNKSAAKTNTNPNPNKRHRRHVRFHSVELQEYSVTVGDHPYCKGYFPLTLDWSHSRPVEFRINDYEAQKQQQQRRRVFGRSSLSSLHLNSRERWERLRLVTGMNETALAQLERIRHHRQQ